MIRLMQRVLKLSGSYKKDIQLAFVFSFLKSICMKTPIMLSFYAIVLFLKDEMTTTQCIYIGIGMMIGLILQILFQNISDRLQSASGYYIFAEKRLYLADHLRKLPMGYFTEGNIGKISSVLSSDMVFVEENCMTVIANMMSYILSQALMIVMLTYLHVYFGITAIIIIVIVVIISKKMNAVSQVDSDIRQNQNQELTEEVLDFVEGISIAKSYNLLGEKSKTLNDSFKKTCSTSIDFEEHITPYQKGLNILYGVGIFIILILALVLQEDGMLETYNTLGLLLFVFDLFGPIRSLYSQNTRLTVMSSCMDRVEELFDEKEIKIVDKPMNPKAEKGVELSFENVSFSYDTKRVLNDVSFHVEKNTTLALVGPSGGGKSTIANLITRFWDIDEGSIQVKGNDIRDISLSSLMDCISVVFQRVYLFQDTVYKNILMGNINASKEDVIEAAKKARCYDFIMELPNGFDTVVGEGGASLSGGEKQRISIARCILKDAPIIILDEATASVDVDNERYIQEAINELCKGKTLIVIAHRIHTIKDADQILVIDDGRVKEAGSHQELLDVNGTYAKFVEKYKEPTKWNVAKGN